MTVSYLVGPLVTTKDYIRAEHKLQSISKLFISQIIIQQVFFFLLFLILPIYIPRALSAGTCIRQGDFAGLQRNHVLATANTRQIERGFGKNAGEWAGSVEIRKKNPWQ